MRVLKYAIIGVAALAGLAAAYLMVLAWSTNRSIAAFEAQVKARATQRTGDAQAMASLPAPVRRYFAFTFPDGPPQGIAWVEMEMEGQFRRPLTTAFESTTARQVVAVNQPDMAFSARTPVLGPVWALAYDVYLAGQMEMKAKLLSAITVMEQASSPALDRISLRRWLIESPTYPMALLPGGPVAWEPIDDLRARMVARAHGQEASLVATFRPDGSLERLDAEGDGDLTTPYHGSGEHTGRDEYRLVEGMRLPMSFTIARAAGGVLHPFWTGRIISIVFKRH